MNRTIVIAEIGSCHDGDFQKAVRLVQAAADAGCDIVKAQYWSDGARLAERRRATDYLDVYKRYAVPFDWIPELAREAEERGIQFACSTYLPEDVYPISKHAQTLKISSFEANDPELLSAHVGPALAGARVLVSCGMGANIELIDRFLTRPIGLLQNKVAFLHCVSAYPAPDNELNLLSIQPFSIAHSRAVGFSDHSHPIHTLTGALAVACGARILERHLRLDETDDVNPDAATAMCPLGLRRYVESVRTAERMLGTDHSINSGGMFQALSEREMVNYRVTDVVKRRDTRW